MDFSCALSSKSQVKSSGSQPDALVHRDFELDGWFSKLLWVLIRFPMCHNGYYDQFEWHLFEDAIDPRRN